MAENTYFEPLNARDAWFLYAERPETPMDLATVYIFESGSRVDGGAGAEGIERTVAERLHLVPRYRMKLRRVPFNLGHPVWIDDPDFDVRHHIHHEFLPPPGDGASFRKLVATVLTRPMDMRRPLWEMTVIHGLRNGRVVVLNRAHHAMVDGVSSADIATLLLDITPEGTHPEPPEVPWSPRPAPSGWDLLKPILWDPFPDRRTRRTIAPRVWGAWKQPWRGMLSVGRQQFTGKPDLFFNRKIGLQRTGQGVKVPLEQFKALKNRYGCTVNDAVLAVVAESLHRWFVARGDSVPERVRVFCPVSIRDESQHNQLGNRISGMVLELPTGEMPIEARLEGIQRRTGDLKKSRQAVAADHLAGLADFAPAALLVLAGRVMSNPQGGANMNVTNVPGPQFALYSGGAELLEIWPFAPLYPGMGLGIAIVSYNGNVYFGLSADPGLVPDAEEFTAHIRTAAENCFTLVGV